MTPERPTGLTDADIARDPEAAATRAGRRLFADGFLGVALDAPASVSLGGAEALPAVACHGRTLREARGLHFATAAVLTAVRLEDHAVFAGLALPPPEPDGRAPSTEDPGEGRTLSSYALDARAALRLPWKQGEYLLTVLLRDRCSNRVRVALERDRTSFTDLEVERFLDARRPPRRPPALRPRPAFPVPSYARLPGSPPVPDAAGVALAIDRVIVTTPSAQAILCGSFRLPLPAWSVVHFVGDEALTADDAALASPDEPPRVITAVLPIGLVLTGADHAEPHVIALAVPTHDAIERGVPGREVTGHFAVDLFALAHLAHAPQTYFVYAFAGEVMSAPVPFALVDEKTVAAAEREHRTP